MLDLRIQLKIRAIGLRLGIPCGCGLEIFARQKSTKMSHEAIFGIDLVLVSVN
jgi:hypothetical protein